MTKLQNIANLLNPYCTEQEIKQFLLCCEDRPVSSLLVNTYFPESLSFLKDLKHDEEDALLYRFDKETFSLGKSVEHFGGAFYMLDPSSATISYYLSPLLKQNFVSIDLCGAPGGKSISLAMRRHDGLYLCNDISYTRAVEIQKNTQRLGLSNVLSVSMDPVKMDLPAAFDLVILDVPCSGSGMFRKEEKMLDDWSMEKVERLLPVQMELLEKSYHLLKKDGIIAYSTCSLSVQEDEEQVEQFLKRHSDMELIECKIRKDIVKGVKGIGYHMVPGIFDGEGIYFALLRKKGGAEFSFQELKNKGSSPLTETKLFAYRKNEYIVSRIYKELIDLPFIAPGVKIHDDSPYPKCIYDHAYSKVCQDIPKVSIEESLAKEYIRGNEISLSDSTVKDGLVVLCYLGYPLGFGKKVKNRIKNYLPKGLRENL